MSLLNLTDNNLDDALRRLRLEEGDIILYDPSRIRSEDLGGIRVPSHLAGIPCVPVECEPREGVADAICRLPKDKLREFVNRLNSIL